MKGHFNRRIFWIGLILVCSLVGYGAWDHRHCWIEHNFRAVEAGAIYAGGYQYPGPLRRILRRQGIRAVVCLRRPGDTYDEMEQQVLREEAVRFIRIAIPKGPSIEPKLESVERAAAAIADPNNQPVLVHCWGGKHRVGAVLGVYRAGYCGWSESDALGELTGWYDWFETPLWPVQVLAAYCERSRLRQSAGFVVNPGRRGWTAGCATGFAEQIRSQCPSR